MTPQLLHNSATTLSDAVPPARQPMVRVPGRVPESVRPEWSPRGFEILQVLGDIFDALESSTGEPSIDCEPAAAGSLLQPRAD